MNPKQSAQLIQRYATEAIEGLRTQGTTADTEHRLTDIRDLAQKIERGHRGKTKGQTSA